MENVVEIAAFKISIETLAGLGSCRVRQTKEDACWQRPKEWNKGPEIASYTQP
jgi:hypothetical protein